MKNLYLVVVLIFICGLHTIAQTVNIDDDKSTGLKGGLSYLNNNVFMGRTDLITSKTITPSISYNAKSGIYVSGSANFILGEKRKSLDGSSLELGYNYEIGDNFYGGLSFSKYFYNSSSTRITSAISSFANAYLNYDLGDIITPELSVSYSISSRKEHNDVFITPGLTHIFTIDHVFADKNTLDIEPEATVNTGTQNFYNGYFNRRRRINQAATDRISAADASTLTKFTLLDYEISLPVKFKRSNYVFAFTPSYAFPQNKLPDAVISKITDKKSLFYFEVSLLFKFH
ncbi:hypothetical protein [Mucilaginibacter arboris]|uniref:DUF481 domain-containing protein n=1 Tax=Mucilaginibacter arboris TaxID=2682090 RepID=A0A7K1SU68_9SPHI|nr:hypothetical protein [Mucilaginibacter arboris]MVN20865.1 hypothetical protein [Mucilaginibacter arboris]